MSLPLILFTKRVIESVSVQPEGVVIFKPIIVGEEIEVWSMFNVVLAE